MTSRRRTSNRWPVINCLTSRHPQVQADDFACAAGGLSARPQDLTDRSTARVSSTATPGQSAPSKRTTGSKLHKVSDLPMRFPLCANYAPRVSAPLSSDRRLRPGLPTYPRSAGGLPQRTPAGPGLHQLQQPRQFPRRLVRTSATPLIRNRRASWRSGDAWPSLPDGH
jgi:hypothetical protein